MLVCNVERLTYKEQAIFSLKIFFFNKEATRIMKRARMVLAAIVVFTVVGGAVAFKKTIK
ncbi:hypothetical protein [uncultured Chitinophaga sp.]|uniref:hypothetical protein n=1 Tax=uncultured Chitinophaga sp. TaxID=339340 RepID=UPI00261A7EB2|nr:hypothetical protein [uncultured Chitinophaga sp.]